MREESNGLSKRGWIRRYGGPIKEGLRAARSENSQPDSSERLRDNVVEKVGEAACVALIVSLAIKGSKDQVVTYGVDSESRMIDLRDFKAKLGLVGEFSSITGNLATAAFDLNASWSNSYHKSRQVCSSRPVTNCTTGTNGSTNCTTTIETECHTEWYWEEPSDLTRKKIDHNRLERWTEISAIKDRSSRVVSDGPQAFNVLEGENVVYYTEKASDSKKQLILAIPVYSVVGGAFIFYEEALNQVSKATSDYGEPVIDDNRFMKRRTFLKLVASGGLWVFVRDIQRRFAVGNKDLLTNIKRHTQSVIDGLDVPSDEIFQRFFGMGPIELRQRMVDMREGGRSVIDGSYNGNIFDPHWGEVKNRFERLTVEVDEAVQRFDNLFSFDTQTNTYSIPRGLTDVIKCVMGTEQIVNYVNGRTSEVQMRHLLNAGTMFLGLAGFAAMSEFVVLPVSDILLD